MHSDCATRYAVDMIIRCATLVIGHLLHVCCSDASSEDSSLVTDIGKTGTSVNTT